MIRTHTTQLTDSELRSELEAWNTVLFVGGVADWVEIDRQVERLGFGELYIVGASKALNDSSFTVSVKPVAVPA
jgi:ATP-dependent protease HslVU (ClpYQ) peptidase subunit